MATHDLTTSAARRLAMEAHGLNKARPKGRIGRSHVGAVVDQIGLLQIDSVNVVCRSHYLPLFARLGPYNQDLLHDMAASGELVEGWIHQATFIPARDHHLFEWRRRESRELQVPARTARWVTEHEDLIAEVLQQIRERGPLTGRDFSDNNVKRGPWWGWGDAKMALEWLFRTGDVGSLRTPQFERRYDLMERVLPPEFMDLDPPSRDEAHRRLITMAARHLGVATAPELADYHRLKPAEVRGHIRDLVADGELIEVAVQDWSEPGYVRSDWKRVRRDSVSALISPFDPVTWHRDRADQLFQFHYRIEIYTPKPKRIYGYYVLPFVHRSGIRARVDVKLDRKASLLRVLSAWGEAHDDDPADTASALATELGSLAEFLGADDIAVEPHGDLSDELLRHT